MLFRSGISVQCSCGACQSRSRYGIKKDLYGCRCGLVCKGRGYCIEEQRQPERRQSTEPYTAGTAEKIDLLSKILL